MNKKYFILNLILTVFTVTVFFSCSKSTIQEARLAYEKKEYFVSGDTYRKIYSKTKAKDEKIESSYKAAECYRLMNDSKNAESWYRKALKIEPSNADAQLKLAKSLKANQKFEEAIVEFKNYQKMSPGANLTVERQIKGCENALKWKNDKTRYNVENVKNLNTKWEDFAPQWFKKDQIYFTSDREKGASSSRYDWTGNMHTDLYTVLYKADKKNPNNISYQLPALVDKNRLNGKLNDGVICFDSKFSTAYLTRCNYDNNLKGKSCRLYTSTLSGSEWSEPEALPFSSDSFNCGQPTLSKDGQTMYFSSDMPGSVGGKDIWMVTYSKRSKTWGDPVNLGQTINTEDDEMYPFLHEDGSLYFASAGHVGLGGTDIFYTKGEGTDWSDPINMKSPINSHGDDFAIILSKDKESGYFSSNRDGGKGQDDIYRFSMTPLVFNLSGVVRHSETKAILRNATVTITNSTDTGKIIFKTDELGSYKLKLKSYTDYELFAAKIMYYDSKLEFQTTKGLLQSTDLVQDFELRPIGLDQFTVRGILYDLDKANIRPDAARILDSLVLILKKYPMVTIELGSHTDCRADSIYNIGLSQRRADSAVAYLILHGIDSARLVSRGYGENELEIKECACEGPNEREQGRKCPEEQHQLNRRTTVKVLTIDYDPKPKAIPPPVTPPKVTRPGTRPAPTQQPRR
ncbi:MAG: PD40 domain-containing protein [Bacteroidia bacterium]|nr:PD40 domain-containing protein [Bacteroidia bacterium]